MQNCPWHCCIYWDCFVSWFCEEIKSTLSPWRSSQYMYVVDSRLQMLTWVSKSVIYTPPQNTFQPTLGSQLWQSFDTIYTLDLTLPAYLSLPRLDLFFGGLNSLLNSGAISLFTPQDQLLTSGCCITLSLAQQPFGSWLLARECRMHNCCCSEVWQHMPICDVIVEIAPPWCCPLIPLLPVKTPSGADLHAPRKGCHRNRGETRGWRGGRCWRRRYVCWTVVLCSYYPLGFQL